MKKVLAAALGLTALLCLTACGAVAAEPPDSAVIPEKPEMSGIVNDNGHAETLQDYYDRTAIIARNEWLEGSFIQVESWVREYASLEHPDCQVEILRQHGYTAPGGVFLDDLRGGCETWNIMTCGEAGEIVEEAVEVYYFAENGKITLSGLLSGKDLLQSRPDGYAYLMLDTRFADRMQALPEVEEAEGTTAIDLSTLLSDAEQAIPLNGDVIAVIGSPWEIVDGKRVSHLAVCDLKTGETLLKESYDTLWSLEEAKENRVDFTDESGTLRLTVTLEHGEPTAQVSEVGNTVFTYQGKDVTERGGSMFYDGKPILEYTENAPGDETSGTGFYFLGKLDDHRFVYQCAGWEWTEYGGVYDLASGENHAFRIGEDNWGRALWKYSGEKQMGLLYRINEVGSWDFDLVDLNTWEVTHPNLPYDTEEQAISGYIDVNESFTRMCTWEQNWEREEVCLTVRSLPDCEVLYTCRFPWDSVNSISDVCLVGDDTVTVSLRRWDTDSLWLYRITY